MRSKLALAGLMVAAAASLAPAPVPPMKNPVPLRPFPRSAPPVPHIPPPLSEIAPSDADGAVPLPRPRPQAAPDGLANLGVPSIGAGPEPQPLTPCFLALTAEIGVAEPAPPIALPNSCDALDAVKLSAVNLDRRRLTLTPPALLRCPMAGALANWMRTDVAAIAQTFGAPLKGFDNYESFECRGRNRIAGAKTSEHGKANALDIRAVLLEDGRRVELTDPEVPKEFRDSMRASACDRFATVLGPGSDGYHESHIHVDLAERRNNYKLCQWDVRVLVIPLPRPRPAEAPPREEL